VIVVPTMNIRLMKTPQYDRAIKILREEGVFIIPPKIEEDKAKYPPIEDLTHRIDALINRGRDLEGARVLVTAGATVEHIDPVRVITNPSSGLMGILVARMATKVGVGRPIIQRLGDLERGRRSTWERISRSTIAPTLRDSTPGDISLVLPHRVVSNILEAISRLDVIYPGLASPQTLIYAPEIKYYGVVVEVGKNMETSVEGIYVASDGAGLSRGINIAATTGVLAARGIVSPL